MTILVTGVAGFIGSHVAERLLARGDEVVGIDNLNDYYSVALKQARLARLEGRRGFTFRRLDHADREAVEGLFAKGDFARVVHLGAQAGVRYSIENPHAYVRSNVVGFMNVLEGCRRAEVAHLVYASSSSVYGANTRMPFSVHAGADHPLSLYGATKKSNEAMAHAYSHLYGIPSTGLRFFTVYGPWGRPDMTPILFAEAIWRGEPIDVYGEGRVRRDFTYVDDIVDGVVRVLDRPAAPDPEWRSGTPDPGRSKAPWRLYNIGGHRPVELNRFIALLEQHLGKKADVRHKPLPASDVPMTDADVSDLADDTGYAAQTPVETGVERFVEWFRRDYLPLIGG